MSDAPTDLKFNGEDFLSHLKMEKRFESLKQGVENRCF